jgi:ADP-ribose pyrophosphatase YjhB (NUDIX family)
MTLSGAIHTLDELCGDPRGGLPEELFLFISRVTPLVNVDLLIQDPERGTLLTWRSDRHHGAGWHVPGGIIRYQETAHRRISEVARQELGAAIDFDPDPIAVMESIDRESRGGNRGHFISLLYRCRLRSAPDPGLKAGDPPQPGSWRWHARPPEDLLKVHDMYRRFLG